MIVFLLSDVQPIFSSSPWTRSQCCRWMTVLAISCVRTFRGHMFTKRTSGYGSGSSWSYVREPVLAQSYGATGWSTAKTTKRILKTADRGIERVVRSALANGLTLQSHGSDRRTQPLVIACCCRLSPNVGVGRDMGAARIRRQAYSIIRVLRPRQKEPQRRQLAPAADDVAHAGQSEPRTELVATFRRERRIRQRKRPERAT